LTRQKSFGWINKPTGSAIEYGQECPSGISHEARKREQKRESNGRALIGINP
jgi:hypothetical protein